MGDPWPVTDGPKIPIPAVVNGCYPIRNTVCRLQSKAFRTGYKASGSASLSMAGALLFYERGGEVMTVYDVSEGGRQMIWGEGAEPDLKSTNAYIRAHGGNPQVPD